MMKIKLKVLLGLPLMVICLVLANLEVKAQESPLQAPSMPKNYPWSNNDLIQPSVLAQDIKDSKPVTPIIFNIGVAGNIKGARTLGAASELKNLEEFKKELKKLPLNTPIVFYCGCCPFERCPNIRPAFKLVKEMGFTQAKLLNLATNLKTDWVAKGYPMN